MNAGRVELDLVAVGKDQVSAMLRTIEAQVKKTGAEMSSAGQAAKTLGDRVDGVKSGIAPLNKVKEAFNQVRENAFFVVGAVAGVVVGLGKLSDAFSSNASAIRAWEEDQKKVKDYLLKTKDLVEDIGKLLGDPQKNEFEKASERVLERWRENEDAIAKADDALRGYKEQQKDLANSVGTWAPEYERLSREIAKSETQRTELMREQATLIESNTRLLAEQARVAGLGFRQDVKDAGGTPFIVKYPAGGGGGGGRGGGGGGRRRGPDTSAVFQFADPSGGLTDFNSLNANAMNDVWRSPFADALNLDALTGSGGNAGRDSNDALSQQRDRFNELADAVARFSGEMGPVLDEVFPGLGTSIQGVDSIMGAFAETTESTAKAQVAAAATGAGAVLGGIGKMMGGKRGMFIGEAIGEEAAALASLAVGDLQGFGTHQAAAAGYFAAAAAMGGGSGGSRGAGGGGGGGSRGGSGGGYNGPTTVINNFSTLVTDPHQVARATASVERSTRGTGSRRGG